MVGDRVLLHPAGEHRFKFVGCCISKAGAADRVVGALCLWLFDFLSAFFLCLFEEVHLVLKASCRLYF